MLPQDRQYLSLSQARDKALSIDWKAQPRPGKLEAVAKYLLMNTGQCEKDPLCISTWVNSLDGTGVKNTFLLLPVLANWLQAASPISRKKPNLFFVKTSSLFFGFLHSAASVLGHACFPGVRLAQSGGLNWLEALLWRVAAEGTLPQQGIPKDFQRQDRRYEIKSSYSSSSLLIVFNQTYYLFTSNPSLLGA